MAETVRMQLPDGSVWDVPKEGVKEAREAGARMTRDQGAPADASSSNRMRPAHSSSLIATPGNAPIGQDEREQFKREDIGAFAGALPPAGGVAGSLVGLASKIPGAGTVLGAGGQTLGEFGRQKIVESMGGQIEDPGGEMRTAALEGGGAHLLGQGISKGLGALGRGLMHDVLQPTTSTVKLAADQARRESGKKVYPTDIDIAQQAIDEKIAVGTLPGRKSQSVSGLQTIDEKIAPLVKKLDDLIAAADKNGFAGSRRDLIRSLNELRKEASVDPIGRAGRLKALQGVVDDLLKMKGDRVPASKLQELKRKWQKGAAPVRKAQIENQVVSDDISTVAQARDLLGRTARKKLEQIPGVKETNLQIARLKPLEAAVRQAENTLTPVHIGAIPWGGTFIPSYLRNPGAISRAALKISSPEVLGAAHAAPFGADMFRPRLNLWVKPDGSITITDDENNPPE